MSPRSRGITRQSARVDEFVRGPPELCDEAIEVALIGRVALGIDRRPERERHPRSPGGRRCFALRPPSLRAPHARQDHRRASAARPARHRSGSAGACPAPGSRFPPARSRPRIPRRPRRPPHRGRRRPAVRAGSGSAGSAAGTSRSRFARRSPRRRGSETLAGVATPPRPPGTASSRTLTWTNARIAGPSSGTWWIPATLRRNRRRTTAAASGTPTRHHALRSPCDGATVGTVPVTTGTPPPSGSPRREHRLERLVEVLEAELAGHHAVEIERARAPSAPSPGSPPTGSHRRRR